MKVTNFYVGSSQQVNPNLTLNDIQHIFYKTDAVGQGTWAFFAQNAGAFPSGSLQNSSAANGDNCTVNVYIPAGTYNIDMYFSTYTNGGKVDVTLDGVALFTGVDTYLGLPANLTLQSATNVVVSGTGSHAFLFTLNGKNGASAGYFGRICWMRLSRVV